jgi:hypothetical protein
VSQGESSVERSDALADELERRGVAGPAAILMDAHRPLLPLLRQGAIFLGPLLSPLLGPRRFDELRHALDDASTYDEIAARLAASRRDIPR